MDAQGFCLQRYKAVSTNEKNSAITREIISAAAIGSDIQMELGWMDSACQSLFFRRYAAIPQKNQKCS
ncbi:MAG: hypothetical protein ACFBSF_07045 [Leptolyngbyaceae cyanobacterium]